MDAEACTRFAINVRDSACGLYENLSSGKSCAMAINFRPMSFHASSTPSDWLGAGPGAFFGASCAPRGANAKATANHTNANLEKHFISFLLRAFRRRASYPLQTYRPSGCFTERLEKGMPTRPPPGLTATVVNEHAKEMHLASKNNSTDGKRGFAQPSVIAPTVRHFYCADPAS